MHVVITNQLNTQGRPFADFAEKFLLLQCFVLRTLVSLVSPDFQLPLLNSGMLWSPPGLSLSAPWSGNSSGSQLKQFHGAQFICLLSFKKLS